MVETYQVLQYVSIALTGVSMLICCLLPWRIKKYKNAALYLSIGSCFGSGVILGAAFSHMVPDAIESFETYFGKDNDSKVARYPWAMFICIVILLILITADTVANAAHDSMMGNTHKHEDAGHQNHLVAIFTDHPETKAEVAKTETVKTDPPTTEAVKTREQLKVHSVSLDRPELEGSKKSLEELGATADAVVVRGTKAQIIQAYIFFLALSIHSISDGMSIGAETSSTGFYGITIAVIAHKALDGFALGVPLYYAKLPKFHTVFAIIFCCAMTPLGIGIGIAATANFESTSSNLAKGIVLSISMGSFIFISLWEMLPAGLNQGKWTGIKIIATFLGWGLMALIALWV